MGCGDMFVVLGHETKTRYDRKMQRAVTTTNYFVPAAYNTREDAQKFADEVRHAYHVDIVQMWNPREERTCHLIPYEMEEDTSFFDRMECDSCGFVMDVSEVAYFSFCPNCGAKVMPCE